MSSDRIDSKAHAGELVRESINYGYAPAHSAKV